MRTRAIEKERHNNAQRNKTGGGTADIKTYEPWEEELLSFIKKQNH